MLAIFKREFKSYFQSPIAYVVIGLFMLLSSFFFSLYNLRSGTSDYNATLQSMNIILILVVPLLTMRILAEDRKSGTEVLLFSSPVRISDIILGKYLAILCVFLIMTALLSVHITMLFIFGNPTVSTLIGNLVGFVFFGATLISIGMFASSLTENQIISAIVGFVIIFIWYTISFLGNIIGNDLITSVTNWLSLTSRFSDFNKGVFNIENIVFYLSIIFVFLFLTFRVIEKRRWSQG